MKLLRTFVVLTIIATLSGVAATAQTLDFFGQVRIYGDNSPTSGINGVTVLLYDIGHTVEYSQETHTDSLMWDWYELDSPDGIYYFDDVPERDDYWIEIIVPEGYTLAADTSQPAGWNDNPRFACHVFQHDFFLTMEPENFEPRTIGYWSHQAKVAVTGRGNAQVPADELQDFLDEIYDEFDGATYFPIEGVSSVSGSALTPQDALDTFELSNGGTQGMVNKTKKQLLALLLNVVSGYVDLGYVISEDDRTVSEAIGFAADMITNSGDDIETAKDAVDYINNGWTIPEGWIPEGYDSLYSEGVISEISVSPGIPSKTVLISNYPNPFNPETTLQFSIPQAGNVTLSIFNLQGQQVAELVSGYVEAGNHTAAWNALGYPSGTYIYRLTSDQGSVSGKMLLLK
jgi:hypothetical protein